MDDGENWDKEAVVGEGGKKRNVIGDDEYDYDHHTCQKMKQESDDPPTIS